MKKRAIVVASIFAAIFAPGAHAEWPERPVTVVVAFPPGGNSDIIARITSEWLARALKQSVVVENRSGAGGAIAAEFAARAPANGYTLFSAAAAVLTIIPHMQKVNYDPLRNFMPISIVGTNAVAVAVNPSFPVKTLTELVEYAKSRPGQLNYTAGPTGGMSHLTMAVFFQRAGIKMTHVSYKGGAPAMPDVLAGRIPMIVTNVAEILPYYKSGKLRVLGVSSEVRASQLPEIPTIAEQGYPGFATGTWNGLVAPTGTAKDIISKIADALKSACRDTEFIAKLSDVGVEAICSTPAQFQQRLQSDLAMWGEAVKLTHAASQ